MLKISYHIVVTYMTEKKGGREGNEFLGCSSYCGIRLSIIHLFTNSNTPVPTGFCENIATIWKGLKRKIFQKNVIAGETLEEGKEVMSFACYKLLCNKIHERG